MRVTTVDDRCRLFFRLDFDDFEFFEANLFKKSIVQKEVFWCFGKAFWGHPGGSGGLLERILGALGAIWGRPGGSGRASWGLLGGPGASWGGLGRSWSDLGATF